MLNTHSSLITTEIYLNSKLFSYEKNMFFNVSIRDSYSNLTKVVQVNFRLYGLSGKNVF